MKFDSIREEQVKRTLNKIKSIENVVDKPMFNLQEEEKIEIEVKVDNKVPHGTFIPSKAIAGYWRASEQTFRAMKKDIFSLGGSIDEIAEPYQCESCKTNLDKQFWIFCPYCGESFKE